MKNFDFDTLKKVLNPYLTRAEEYLDFSTHDDVYDIVADIITEEECQDALWVRAHWSGEELSVLYKVKMFYSYDKMLYKVRDMVQDIVNEI